MAKKERWYVVWKGREPGIYNSWIHCKTQTDGFTGAIYKAFDTNKEAVTAYGSNPWQYMAKADANGKKTARSKEANIIKESLSVDAACSGNPGVMEYRGVNTATGEEIFYMGPFNRATNNIGEFLALVHGLAMLKQQNSELPVYSDSVNAILWVKKKKCNTKLQPVEANKAVFNLIERAEKWLQLNNYKNRILKWKTKQWGEIPADFGRK